MARDPNLKRGKPKRHPKPIVALFCEGEITEPEYIRAINRHWDNPVVIQFPPCGTDPKGIVSAAAELKKRSKRLKNSDPNEKIEAVWCLFDRDEHEMIPEALHQAEANDIPVAFSNPCFELWLLLHFQDQTAHLERDEASKLCHRYMPNYLKRPDMSRLLPQLPDAERRAEALYNRQTNNGLSRGNPWTDVHKLVQAIRKLSGQ